MAALAASPAAAQTAADQIDQLRQQLDALQQRIDELESRQQRTTERVEEVQPSVSTEKSGVRLTLAGRINQALLFATQDDQDQAFVVDNDGSGSRLEFLAESDFGDFTSGLEIVISAEVNSTDEIDFGSTDDNADENADLGSFRQAHWFIEHPRYGYFSIGQGDTAAEDTTFVDLSGTSFAGAGADVDDIAGGLTFIDENGDALTEVDDFFDAQDDSRSLRVLYVSPDFYGVRLAASAANDEQALEDADDPEGDGLEPAIGVTYAAEFNDYEFEAAGSWRREDDVEVDRDIFTGSASVLAPFGVNFTLAGSVGDNSDLPGDIDDPTMIFAKIGYRQDFFDFGDTRFSIDGYRGRNEVDFASPDGELPHATGAGLFMVQEVEPLNAELYIGGRLYALDDVFRDDQEVDVENMYAIISGARVRF